MRQLCLLFIAIAILPNLNWAQYAAINYQVEKNYFNEGEPLPAEKNLMFTGLVPEDVDIIEISIFPSKVKNDKDRLYLASWKDFDRNANQNYSLAVNYKLQASGQYDFRFDFFKKLPANEQAELTERLIDQATAYLDASIVIKGNGLSLAKSGKRMVKELDEILQNILSDYRNQNDMGFDGLSATIRQNLEKLEDFDFSKMPRDSSAMAVRTQREATVREKLQVLRAAIVTEIRETMSSSWSKLAISRYVDDYETEKKKGSFSISAGYGGVYLSGELDNLTYGTSPYLGVAFPLSNSTIAPKFLRNSSIILGVFLENFEDENGNTVSGLIVNRPVYLGLDYKLFEFIRFNAGAALLEKSESNGTGVDVVGTKAFIRPFVGLSARIDLTVGFGK